MPANQPASRRRSALSVICYMVVSTISDLDLESAVSILSTREVAGWGFRTGDRGTHTSRTIMLQELTHLIAATVVTATHHDYVQAVMEENCLGKRTVATRRLSIQRLTELYGLDRRLLLFRVLRELWERHESSRGLLAMLLALARDPLLRATARAVVDTPHGHEFARQAMTDALSDVAVGRLNEATLDKVVRNAASSWTQSGHLRGRSRKTRQHVRATPAATAYALLLGYGCGSRGRLLFGSPWCAILDAPKSDLLELAVEAKSLGLIDLKQSGSIMDVSFAAVLAGPSRGASHGAHRQAG